MKENKLEEINCNIEEIWHRLDGIDHSLREISQYGILSSEIQDSIVAIARALNKDFDEKYKEMEKAIAGKV